MASKRKRIEVAVDSAREIEFDRAFELLGELVDLSEAEQIMPSGDNTVYTASVVLWMLVYQRLKPDASLETAVKHLIETQPTYLPDNKRVREGTLSPNTSSYSRARTRLSLEVAQWFANQVSRSLIATSKPTFDDQRVFILDGTTITLAPEKELQKAFPPASNQHGEGTWPVALLAVLHELASGCALLPEVGPMYGEHAVSETTLARKSFEQLPENSIVMADSGFGIFSVAHAAANAKHDFVFRMTKVRFHSLRKKATLIDQGDHWKTFTHPWTPTAQERKANPHLPAEAVIQVRLHEVEINEHLTLQLVTSLDDHAYGLADLFERRVDIEIDIRNLKVVLNTENIRAKSVDMFMKELWTSTAAYNLVSQLRRQAAELINVAPRRMSFKRTWTTFQTFLLRHMHSDAASWRESFQRALYYATQDKLPIRPNRKYKREAYQRRPKSDQFPNRIKPASKLTPKDVPK